MYDLKKYCPIHLDNLVRLGRDSDGGYVIAKSQIELTEILLSFGICDDWSFESDFLKNKHIAIYAFDYSISKELQRMQIRDNIGCMLGSLLVLRRSKVIKYAQEIKKIKEQSKKLYNFFKPKLDRYFLPKYIGETDDKVYITFNKIFDKLPSLNDISVFVKMDIEGAEYKTLPQLIPYFEKINGLVVEFHELHEPQQFGRIMEMFQKQFYIAHVHANSSCGCITNTNLPNLLEITFINKKIITTPISHSKRKYPIEGLDYPNTRDTPQIDLMFS